MDDRDEQPDDTGGAEPKHHKEYRGVLWWFETPAAERLLILLADAQWIAVALAAVVIVAWSLWG